jgi:hypothetical protein
MESRGWDSGQELWKVLVPEWGSAHLTPLEQWDRLVLWLDQDFEKSLGRAKPQATGPI